jgi:hypothetical protein
MRNINNRIAKKKKKEKEPDATVFECIKIFNQFSNIAGECRPIKQIKPNAIVTFSNRNSKFGIEILFLFIRHSKI